MNEGTRSRCRTAMKGSPTGQGFADIDKSIAEGGIAVFCEIKAPPFEAKSELLELRIVLPAKWTSELLERIEACIDEFGEEKGAGRTRVVDEGTVS
jgi:hypothetical protein